MSRPRLLDLFCGAGGAGVGYHRAGFDVTGVDDAPQRRYPFAFVQADALAYVAAHGAEYDAIHASPPCQAYSTLTRQHGAAAIAAHAELVAPVRELLVATGRPYVIENVPGAPLVAPVVLCGSMFGLGAVVAGAPRQLRRHRLFESTVWLWPPAPCAHTGRTIGVYGNPGGKSRRDRVTFGGVDVWREAMGAPWMVAAELAEAIPPAYTEHVGAQLLQALAVAA